MLDPTRPMTALPGPSRGPLSRLPSAREAVCQFTPNRVTATMVTGILAMNQLPFGLPGAHAVARALWLFDIFLFVLFSALHAARCVFFFDRARRIIRHSVMSMFFGATPMGLATIIDAFLAFGLSVIGAFVAIHDIGTYDHLRGAVCGPFHGGPVSPTRHHVTLTDGVLLADGGVRVHASLDAGTPEAQLHLVEAALIGPDKIVLARRDTRALSALPKTDFANDYAYNRFRTGPSGIRAPMGAAATITLPPASATPPSGAVTLRMTDVERSVFDTTLKAAP